MVGKVGLRRVGYSAGAHMPRYGDGRKQESEKAEDRDGKEDIHAPVRRITSAGGSRILFDQCCRLQAESMIWSGMQFLAEAVLTRYALRAKGVFHLTVK